MSRSRRAAGSWPTREAEVEDPEPRWSSLTDTGSMAPSDEALVWQRRADDWAQHSEVEPHGGGGQAIEPANRWSSEVSSTGRPTFPADGVGWRTETAEWRATGARWRQTTEWRSATGSHVWRSTTEAWRGDEDNPAKNDKPAISGTAWPTPDADADADESATPSWRQNGSASQSIPAASREQPVPSWRQSEPETPSWRRDEPETSSSWRLRTDGPAATTPVEQTRSGSASWQQPSSQTPSWQQPSSQTPSWQEPSAQTPSWQQPADAAPSRQPADPVPSWQQPQQSPSWQQSPAQPPSPPSRSRRRADETGSWSSAASTGTTWSDKPATTGGNWSDKPATTGGNWSDKPAGGGTWSDKPAATGGNWSDNSPAGGTWSDTSAGGATNWSERGASPDASRSDRPAPGENTGGLTRWERTDAPGWQRSPVEDARHLVREDDRAAWRRDADYGERPTRVGRRRAAESGAAPSGGSGWSSGSDPDNWAGHTDTGSIPAFSDTDTGPEPAPWSARSEAPSRRERRRYAETAAPEPVRPDPVRPDLSRPDLSRADLARPEPTRPEPGRSERARPGAVRPDQTGLSSSRQPPGKQGGRPRYNANATNWREDTASWDAEQDTSNWTRDPDTGQWSRAEDDPRVLAWRAEAARREAGRDPEGEESTGWNLRPDDPVGGVPGGPLPSSSVPSGYDNPGWDTRAVPNSTPSGATPPAPRPRSALPGPAGYDNPGWDTGAVPNSAPSGATPPATRPRSALPGPVGPADERQGRRRRADDPYPADDYAGGRRRRAVDGAPGMGSSDEPSTNTQGWQLPPESRTGRQYRRIDVEPDEYPTGPTRPGPRPPQWQEPYAAEPERPRPPQWQDPSVSEAGRPRPPQWQDPSDPEPRRPRPPQWQDPAGREQRRSGYRDGAPDDGPGWQDPSAYGQPREPQQPRSGFGSAARELPAGPSAQPQRPAYGGTARELPAGPSAQPQRPAYGGPARALPAGPSAYGDVTTTGSAYSTPGTETARPDQGRRQRPGGEPAWLDQQRQQQAPERPGGDPSRLGQERRQQPSQYADGEPAWPAQEWQQESPQPPVSGPSWLDEERRRQGPQRPVSGPSWLDEERRRPGPQAPAYGGPGAEQSWSDQRQAPGGEPAWLDREGQRGLAYGGTARIPAQPAGDGARWQDSADPGRPAYGSARALPAGGTAPTSGPAWSSQQKPAYDTSGDLSARWPDPLTDQSGRRGYGDQDDDPPSSGGGFSDRPPLADWLAAERAGRRGADYRGGAGQDGETDWRRELSRQSDLAEGESRRYDTSDFPPFRPSGSAAVNGSSNLALSATSVISTSGTSTATAERPEEDTSWPPRRSTGAFQGTGSYERRPVSNEFLTSRPSDLLDPVDDEEDEQASSPLAAVGYTVVWYGVPVVLFVAGMFVLNSGQRTHALDTLADAAPEFAVSLALSMLVAFVLRSATAAWKSASVGLAAAVVGGGLATVLSSAITGNSLS